MSSPELNRAADVTEIADTFHVKYQALLAASPEALLDPAGRAHLLQILQGLLFLDEPDSARQVAGRLAGLLLHEDPDIRRRAADAAASLLPTSAPPIQEILLAAFADPLRRAVIEETEFRALQALPPAVAAWGRVAVELARWPQLAAMYTTGLKVRLDRPGTPLGFAHALRAAMHRLGDVEGRHPILDIVETGPDSLKRLMDPLLPILGAPLVPVLSQTILNARTVAIARAAAASLARIDLQAAAHLAIDGVAGAPAAQALRILAVLDVLRPPNVGATLIAALGHEDDAVRTEASTVLGHLDRPYAVAILRTLLLRADSARVLGAALEVARARRLSELTPELVRVAQTTSSDRVFTLAMEALAAFPSPAAVAGFRLAFKRGGGFLGRKLCRPEEARVLAAAGALKVETEEARQVLAEASRDPSDAVRKAGCRS